MELLSRMDCRCNECNEFDEKTQNIVKPIFENGTYWLHPEYVLLAAVADSRQEIRSQAVEQILRIRHDERTKKLAEEEQLRLKKEKNAHSKDREFS